MFGHHLHYCHLSWGFGSRINLRRIQQNAAMEIYEIILHSMVYGGIFHVSQNRNATHQISLQSQKVAVGNAEK